MTRIWRILIPAGLALLAAAAVAVASGGRPTVQLAKTKLGKIIVNSKGFTVYMFTKDGRNKDRCVSTKGCIAVWPAVTTTGRPVAGSGLRSSLLGTIPYKGKARQVTYNGHPLYTYLGDSEKAQTSYVNISQYGGRWPALNAAGGAVK
jgi:predicted lipoprotein with Yx(FWY)xxD motif